MPAANDRKQMLEVIALAEQGRGLTRPNPLVGSVIVKANRVVGRGYHHGAGKPHAEVLALRQAGRSAKGATLYVNLEPCCHTGRTGPCTEAIIKAGIKRVVFAANDPDPRVAGRGARILRKAGISVTSGICRKEAQELNDAYFAYYRNRRPFVILKLAQSLDGRIATLNGHSRWISSPESRRLAHRLRSEVDAVVVGAGTVRADNPRLTVRDFPGLNPYRIVVEGRHPVSRKSRLFTENKDMLTILVTGDRRKTEPSSGRLITWTVSGDPEGLDPCEIVTRAGEFGMRSLLVEGGAALATSFLRSKIVDKIVLITAPKIIGEGINGIGSLAVESVDDSLRLDEVSYSSMGGDLVISGYPRWEEVVCSPV